MYNWKTLLKIQYILETEVLLTWFSHDLIVLVSAINTLEGIPSGPLLPVMNFLRQHSKSRSAHKGIICHGTNRGFKPIWFLKLKFFFSCKTSYSQFHLKSHDTHNTKRSNDISFSYNIDVWSGGGHKALDTTEGFFLDHWRAVFFCLYKIYNIFTSFLHCHLGALCFTEIFSSIGLSSSD